MKLTDGVSVPKISATPMVRIRKIGEKLELLSHCVDERQPDATMLQSTTTRANAWNRFLGTLAKLELRHAELLSVHESPPPMIRSQIVESMRITSLSGTSRTHLTRVLTLDS